MCIALTSNTRAGLEAGSGTNGNSDRRRLNPIVLCSYKSKMSILFSWHKQSKLEERRSSLTAEAAMGMLSALAVVKDRARGERATAPRAAALKRGDLESDMSRSARQGGRGESKR